MPESLREATNTLLVFYYSGHGTSLDGDNLIIPVDIEASSADALKESGIPFSDVTSALHVPGSASIFIVDADFAPFKRSDR